MSTLLSRIFGRKKNEVSALEPEEGIDVRALKPLMSPSEFAGLKAQYTLGAPPSSDPKDLDPSWPMEQVLKVFPSAQRALFQKYHIGGCSSCGFMPSDRLEKVARDHGLEPTQVVEFIKESEELEKDMEIDPAETAALLKQGAIKLVDVRSPQEFEVAHVEGSILIDQALAQEIISTWPKDTAIVTMCHHGMRSLDAAAYLRGHGLKKVQSMRGGIDAWSRLIDSSIPRY